jgi:hypothetical protein
MTHNPLFDTRSPRCGKSLLTPELKKRFGQPASDKITGYSCDMMIIDDVIDPMQKLLDDYKAWYDKVVALQFSIPESAIKGSVSGSVFFNEAELTAQSFDEKLQKTWGRNY